MVRALRTVRTHVWVRGTTTSSDTPSTAEACMGTAAVPQERSAWLAVGHQIREAQDRGAEDQCQHRHDALTRVAMCPEQRGHGEDHGNEREARQGKLGDASCKRHEGEGNESDRPGVGAQEG